MGLSASLSFILGAAYFITIAGVILTVVLENRNPLKTSAWVLIIGFIPIVGVLSYIIFGQEQRKLYRINKRYYKRLLKRPSQLSILPKNTKYQAKHWKQVVQLVERNSNALLLPIQQMSTYTTGKDFYDNLISDILEAKEHIHIEAYIFEDGQIFAKLSEALIQKKAQGLDIRLIYDYLGSYTMPQEHWRRLSDAGIQVYPFLPVRIPLLSSTVNYRNHRKICIIDGHIGYMGGMNFADRYQEGDKLGQWRDTHFRLVGTAVMSLQSEFLMDWYTVSRRVVPVERFFHQDLSSKQANTLYGQFIFGGPLQTYPAIEQAFVSLIHHAKEYIYIQTPYFLPTESLYNALMVAALAGIDIHLMIPQKGDSLLTGLAMDSYLQELLKVGIHIYRYQQGFIHSKVMTIDGEVAMVGSANMDFRSLEHNFEVSGIIYDKNLAQELEHKFRLDTNDCLRLSSIEWEQRPKVRRLAESVMRLFSPLL